MSPQEHCAKDRLALHSDCAQALKQYLAQAQETLILFAGMAVLKTITMDQRMQLVEQRQRENHAHEAYQVCREQMFASFDQPARDSIEV